MITAVHGPLISQPEQWVLVFDRRPANRWIGWLVPGKYKHVRAYGYVPFLHVWLFHDANLSGIEVWVAADGEPARAMIGQWIAGDCDLVLMPRRPHAGRSPFAALSGWCVPHVKRLIGLSSSALRPTSLFADCLRNGGRLHGPRLPIHTSSNAVSQPGQWSVWHRHWRAAQPRRRWHRANSADADTAASDVAAAAVEPRCRPAAGLHPAAS